MQKWFRRIKNPTWTSFLGLCHTLTKVFFSMMLMTLCTNKLEPVKIKQSSSKGSWPIRQKIGIFDTSRTCLPQPHKYIAIFASQEEELLQIEMQSHQPLYYSQSLFIYTSKLIGLIPKTSAFARCWCHCFFQCQGMSMQRMTCQHLRTHLYFYWTMLEVFGMLLDCCRIKVIKLLFEGAFVASKNLELEIVIETFRKLFEKK